MNKYHVSLSQQEETDEMYKELQVARKELPDRQFQICSSKVESMKKYVRDLDRQEDEEQFNQFLEWKRQNRQIKCKYGSKLAGVRKELYDISKLDQILSYKHQESLDAAKELKYGFISKYEKTFYDFNRLIPLIPCDPMAYKTDISLNTDLPLRLADMVRRLVVSKRLDFWKVPERTNKQQLDAYNKSDKKLELSVLIIVLRGVLQKNQLTMQEFTDPKVKGRVWQEFLDQCDLLRKGIKQ